HSREGGWSSGDETEIKLHKGEAITVSVPVRPAVPMVELFRGQRVLGVVPFASIDIPTVLDGALPENLHTQDADERPQELDAAFMFPEKTFYGTNAAADADPALFRLRLDNVPAGFTDEQLPVTVKVLTKVNDRPVSDFGETPEKGTASHADGMSLVLGKKQGENVWESPYLRVG